MNLHPYLTPELLTLIRTAEPKEIEDKFSYGNRGSDPEWGRLGFHIEFLRGKSLPMISYHKRPIKLITLASASGSNSIKRRVDLSLEKWRDNFMERFNEVLHDCDRIVAKNAAMRDANREREQKAKERKAAVLPLIGELPLHISWHCENRQFITEKMIVDTNKFTPEQIKQVVDLIRSFQP